MPGTSSQDNVFKPENKIHRITKEINDIEMQFYLQIIWAFVTPNLEPQQWGKEVVENQALLSLGHLSHTWLSPGPAGEVIPCSFPSCSMVCILGCHTGSDRHCGQALEKPRKVQAGSIQVFLECVQRMFKWLKLSVHPEFGPKQNEIGNNIYLLIC